MMELFDCGQCANCVHRLQLKVHHEMLEDFLIGLVKSTADDDWRTFDYAMTRGKVASSRVATETTGRYCLVPSIEITPEAA